MFDEYAMEYYKADDLSDYQYDVINKCMARAESKLGKLSPNRRIHDDYVIGFHIYVADEILFCKVEFVSHTRERKRSAMIFRQVTSLNMRGELISNAAAYPSPRNLITFAQILDIWFDYQSCFECCILLDNERYLIIKSEDILFMD